MAKKTLRYSADNINRLLEKIDNLDLSIYDYYLLHYLIPDKESLKKYVLNKMENITDDVIDDIFNKIEELKNTQEN